MKLKLKFELNQKVYYIEDSTIHNGVITKVEYSAYMGAVYSVVGSDMLISDIKESALFDTKEKAEKELGLEKCEFRR